MDSITGAILLAVFLGGIFTLLYFNSGGVLNTSKKRVRRAELSKWSLSEFLHLKKKPSSGKSFLFHEQSVYSLGHRFNGRFDSAVLHWEEAPILDAMIERKFPTRYLPKKPRDEDIFQAGLYALALMETGISCTTTRLILVYCLQVNAKRCIGRNHNDCITCGKGKVFNKRFNQKQVIQSLKRLDEIWYHGRKPIATPNEWKCRGCPYSQNGICNYSAA